MVPKVPVQKRSRAKYTAILQAALDLFEEKGYTETTIDAIVERSQCSVGVFYRYFSSKQQLLEALFAQETVIEESDILSLPQQSLSLEETEALIWRFLRQRRGLLHARQELGLIDPAFAQRERVVQQAQHARLTQELEQLRQVGYIREDTPCATCAWMILATFFHLVSLAERQSEQQLHEEVHATALLIYRMLHRDTDTGNVPDPSR